MYPVKQTSDILRHLKTATEKGSVCGRTSCIYCPLQMEEMRPHSERFGISRSGCVNNIDGTGLGTRCALLAEVLSIPEVRHLANNIDEFIVWRELQECSWVIPGKALRAAAVLIEEEDNGGGTRGSENDPAGAEGA